MKFCPCGSVDYLNCCGSYITEHSLPQTPEALMRSRYTAYTLADTNYIKKTMRGNPLMGFNELEAKKWSASVYWLGLIIINTETSEADRGVVEFKATYLEKNCVRCIHEISQFQLIDTRWFYTEGQVISETPITITRNERCPCGSKKKFKNCHGKT